MAVIKITDIIVPEVYNEYMQEAWYTKNRLWQSGIIAEDQKMNTLLDGGAEMFNFPFWKVNDMEASDAQSVNEDGTLSATKITSGKQVVRRLFFEQAWGKNDVVVVQAGDDPLEAVLQHIGDYWNGQYQKTLFNIIKGVIADNVANDSSDLTNDVSGGGSPAISAANVINTMKKFGDSIKNMTAIAMHSTPYYTLLNADLITFRRTSEQGQEIATYMGLDVIVDDALLVGSTYWTVLFKNKAFMSGFSSQGYTPAEVDRNPAVSGGLTTLYTRRVLAMHPAGFKWVEGSITRTYPAQSDLRGAQHWDRVAASVKNCGFAVLKTTS